MKILLVDDDAFLRDMYATKFSEAGHDVSIAENGAESLLAIEKESFDLILLDMVMPGMTGVALLEEIAKIPKSKDILRVVLSNQGEDSDKKAAEAAGACGYIVKAESIPSEVVAKVEKIFSSK